MPRDTFGNTALLGSPVPQAGDLPLTNLVPMQDAAQRARALQDAGYNTPNITTPKKTEPAVLSSGEVIDEIIPANNRKFEDISKKGTYVGIDGNVYYSDGSMVPAPLEAEYDGKTWNTGGQHYGAGPEIIDNPTDDPSVANTNRILASLKASLDASTLGQVNAIHQQYDILRQQQADANMRNEKGRERALLLGGSARYAPIAAEGSMLAQTSYGLQQIQRLDADENLAIANVREAQRKGNYDVMEKGLATVEELRKEKQKAAEQVATALSAANKKVAEREALVQRDESIARVIASGLTDPASIYAAMRTAGSDVTVKEIKDVIEALVPKSEDKDLYKFTNANLGTLLGAGINAGQIQNLSDYLNGRGDAAAWSELTPEQQVVVQRTLVGKSPGGEGGETTFTTSQINSGATKAGVSLAEFKGFDQDTKNVFINGDLSGTKKTIDEAFESGGDIKIVTKSIQDMGLPQAVEDYLVRYATTKAAENAPLTPEQQKETISSVIKDLQASKYDRNEAKDAIKNKLTDNGKTTLPKALETIVDDAIEETYGATFWQNIIPGGRGAI